MLVDTHVGHIVELEARACTQIWACRHVVGRMVHVRQQTSSEVGWAYPVRRASARWWLVLVAILTSYLLLTAVLTGTQTALESTMESTEVQLPELVCSPRTVQMMCLSATVVRETARSSRSRSRPVRRVLDRATCRS